METKAKQTRSATVSDSLKNFDLLPDAASVREPVVAALYGCSRTQIWRMAKDGRIPAPRKISSRVTVWNVGELRRALNPQACAA